MNKSDHKHVRWSLIAERIVCGLFAALVLVYAIRGVYVDDFYLPSARMAYRGVHFHGLSAWLMSGAMICLAVFVLFFTYRTTVRHHDKRGYRLFGIWIRIIGLSLAVCGIIVRELVR